LEWFPEISSVFVHIFQVDMPVFFYIDPEFVEDPALKGTSTIYLSYTFFEAKDGLQLPLPGYTAMPYSATQAVS
jgi:cytochrome c oxidase assembly protein subunit 11